MADAVKRNAAMATGIMLTSGIGTALFTAWIAIAIAGAVWALLRRRRLIQDHLRSGYQR